MMFVASLSAIQLLVAGCSDNGDSDGRSCKISSAKYETKEEEVVRAAIDEANSLPDGHCLYGVSVKRMSAENSVGVNIYLSVADSKGRLDDLRPAATEIAYIVKRAKFDSLIEDLYVSNLTPENSVDNYVGLLSKNFHNTAWDGSPSREAELASWVVWMPLEK
ncbi:hypothetical protein ACWFRF_21375 [Nocardia sp. NPDC055165]